MTQSIAQIIDHTALSPEATEEEIRRLCREAVEYGFGAVCVNPCRTAIAASYLKDSGVTVATVVGFPLGAATTQIKTQEAIEAVHNGAGEIDMVMNIGKFKDGAYDYVYRDIAAVAQGCGVPLKVIVETCKLTYEEIVKAVEIAEKAGAKYVKTSTGFGGAGATIEHVKLMKHACVNAKVKASGGIKDYDSAVAMAAAGADRIGTSSGIAIVTQEKARQKSE